jgi:phage recombination protein Bet
MANNALARSDAPGFTPAELEVIEKHLFPQGTSQEEQRYCLAVAKQLGLSPLLREIHFVPRRQKVGDKWISKTEPMVGRDGFLAIAHRSGQLAGIETTTSIRDTPVLENGKWVTRPQLTAECVVWRRDSSKPFTVQLAYAEYCQRNSDGQPVRMWAERPETMLKKCSSSQALRLAFNIHGVYGPEELGAGFEDDAGNLVVTAQVIETEDNTERIEEPARKATRRTRSDPEPPPEPVMDDGWPPEPAPRQQAQPRSAGQMTLADVSEMLTARGVKHEVDEECGYVSAKSYAHKDFLKSQGFSFDSEVKAWIWTGARRAA